MTKTLNDIPPAMRLAMLRWVCLGLEPGGFGKSVLSEDWEDAACRADDANRYLIDVYKILVQDYIPRRCLWGFADQHKERAAASPSIPREKDWPEGWRGEVSQVAMMVHRMVADSECDD